MPSQINTLNSHRCVYTYVYSFKAHRLFRQSRRLLPHVILHFDRIRGASCKPFEDLLYWEKTDEIGAKIYWLSSVDIR